MPTQPAQPVLHRRRRWPRRRWIAAIVAASMLWTPAAIGIASLMERTGWWRSPQALWHPAFLQIGVAYEDGVPRFSIEPEKSDTTLLLCPDLSIPSSSFGPFDTHLRKTRSAPRGWRSDGVYLSPAEINRLREPLAQFLASHGDARIRRYANNLATTDWSNDSVLWMGRFWNGSLVLIVLLSLLVLLPLFRAARRTLRLYRNLCAHCAYDLSATPGPICPECGGANPFATPVTLQATEPRPSPRVGLPTPWTGSEPPP